MITYEVVSRDRRIDGLKVSADPKTVARLRALNVYVRSLHAYVDIPTSCLVELDTEETDEPRGQRTLRDYRY